jgi:TPR repeat protein
MIPLLAVAILLAGAGYAQSAVPTNASSHEISVLQKSADAGDAQAEFALGQAYDFGKGIAQNDPAAYAWYRKAAEQGFAPAQNALGLMYREGRGVEQSKEKAVEWYRKAAQQKFAKAMFNLGTAYYNGDGVAINDIAAYAWFLLAQQYGSEPAKDAVNRTASTLNAWQISSSFDTIGDMYEEGKDLPLDHLAAIEWYRKAAQSGEPAANVKLANFLVIQGGDSNHQEALHSCIAAAKKQYAPGALCAGLLYQKGLGAAQNLSEAAKWFDQAAQLGDAKAMFHLAEMYWDGAGVKQDKVSAYAYILLASTADLPKAQQDKAVYEQMLTTKQLEKARQQASKWAKTHNSVGLRLRVPPPS